MAADFPATANQEDDDDLSSVLGDLSDIDDSSSAGDSITDPTWQTSYPAQFSMVPRRDDTPLGELVVQTGNGIFRDCIILDHTYRGRKEPNIRLLQIKSGLFGQKVYCKLVKRPLWDAGQYTALSYSWGPQELSCEIYINGKNGSVHRFGISTHLWAALQRLRHEERDVTVWVDAICVDQQNDVERTAQVSIMAQIYNEANEVRIWLGEEDIVTHTRTTDVELFSSLCQQSSPWWMRLWIVQECAYAKRCPIVMLGAQLVGLDQFIERWKSTIQHTDGLDAGVRDLLEANLEFLQVPFDIWDSQNKTARHRLPLSYRLQQMAGRQCTDPHDKIYALLSLIDEDQAKQLPPDYRKPFPELIAEVMAILSQSQRWDDRQSTEVLKLLQPGPLESVAFSIGRTLREYCDALEQAVQHGYSKITNILVSRCLNFGTDPTNSGGALYTASSNGLENAAKVLIVAKMDVNIQGGPYGNALQAASFHGYEKVVEMLISARADTNAKGGHYGFALQAASVQGHDRVVQMLLETGADINATGGPYSTALHAASYNGYEKVVQVLLDAGANINAQDNRFGNALQVASSGGYEKVVKMLLHRKANVNAQGGTSGNPLQAASFSGHIRVVEILVDCGADVNAKGGKFSTALHAASYAGYTKVVQVLLDAGADVNAQDNCYGNALQAASFSGHKEVVTTLLSRHADVNAEGGIYGNPLQAASSQGYIKVVEILVDSGADVNAKGGKYSNALQAALYRGHKKVVEALMDAGAIIILERGEYGNVLRAASFQGHDKIVEILIGMPTNVEGPEEKYWAAMQAATNQGHKDVIKMLKDADVDFNEHGGVYRSALQVASSRGHEKVVRILLGAGTKVDKRMIQAASAGGHARVVELLTSYQRSWRIPWQPTTSSITSRPPSDGSSPEDTGADINPHEGHSGITPPAASSRNHKLAGDIQGNASATGTTRSRRKAIFRKLNDIIHSVRG